MAALSWRSPARLSRCRSVLPDHTGVGAVPLWRATGVGCGSDRCWRSHRPARPRPARRRPGSHPGLGRPRPALVEVCLQGVDVDRRRPGPMDQICNNPADDRFAASSRSGVSTPAGSVQRRPSPTWPASLPCRRPRARGSTGTGPTEAAVGQRTTRCTPVHCHRRDTTNRPALTSSVAPPTGRRRKTSSAASNVPSLVRCTGG